jgi:hypothetical protein
MEKKHNDLYQEHGKENVSNYPKPKNFKKHKIALILIIILLSIGLFILN